MRPAAIRRSAQRSKPPFTHAPSRRCSPWRRIRKIRVEVRAITYAKLEDLRRRSDANSPLDAYLIHRIKQFQDDPEKFVVAKPIEAPPGMPIGDDEE